MLNQSKLGKLLKYDFRAIFKYFLPMSIFILVYSCFGTLLFDVNDQSKFSQSTLGNILIVIVLITYILMIIVYFITSNFIIIVHFYKNMVTDNGYLTHTLPVKKTTLLLSKLITGLLTLSLSYVVLLVCILIMLDVPTNLWTYYNELSSIIKFSFLYFDSFTLAKLILTCLISVIIATIQTLAMYYASIAIGQLAKSHKALCSFLAFFGLSFVNQVISAIYSVLIENKFSVQNNHVMNTVTTITFGGTLLMIIITCILLFITNYIFTKKLNLE